MNVTTDKRAQGWMAIAPELAPSDRLCAMTTEHSTLQAARSATIFETGVRATLSGSDDLVGVAANTGRRHNRWHFVPHAATTVMVVTAILAGTASAVTLHIAAKPPLSVSAVIGAAAAVGVAVTLLRQQSRAWARADANVESIFPAEEVEK